MEGMRVIKFKAKSIKTGKFIIGTGLTDFLNVYPEYRGSGKTWMWSNYEWHEVDPETVGQYLELKDKNGKEIFQGDRVMLGDVPLEVIYQAPSFVMKRSQKHKTWHEFILSADQNQFCEIIGNIHKQEKLNA